MRYQSLGSSLALLPILRWLTSLVYIETVNTFRLRSALITARPTPHLAVCWRRSGWLARISVLSWPSTGRCPVALRVLSAPRPQYWRSTGGAGPHKFSLPRDLSATCTTQRNGDHCPADLVFLKASKCERGLRRLRNRLQPLAHPPTGSFERGVTQIPTQRSRGGRASGPFTSAASTILVCAGEYAWWRFKLILAAANTYPYLAVHRAHIAVTLTPGLTVELLSASCVRAIFNLLLHPSISLCYIQTRDARTAPSTARSCLRSQECDIILVTYWHWKG